MHTDTLPPVRPAGTPPPPAPAPAPRIDWLFRHALRQRQVHPLMELVRRYREQDAA
jgi:hypothetical protein